MDKLVIRGGNPLLGTVRISGAKNSALPCMAAAILTEDEVVLENIPQVRDIETERRLLVSMGGEVELGYGRAQHRTTISCRALDPVANYEIVKTMRASSLVLGPLVARTVRARVAMPGGCAIGVRGIDPVVANLRIGHCHDLTVIRRIGQDFLIAGHARIEDNLAVALTASPKSVARVNRAVFERQLRDIHFCFQFSL